MRLWLCTIQSDRLGETIGGRISDRFYLRSIRRALTVPVGTSNAAITIPILIGRCVINEAFILAVFAATVFSLLAEKKAANRVDRVVDGLTASEQQCNKKNSGAGGSSGHDKSAF